MGTQLPLPAHWAKLESVRAPAERLDRLRFEVGEAKAEIRIILEELAERHGIPARDVTYSLDGYADDMLSDLVFHVERGLVREIDDE
jgi:hypothetical protein